VNPVAIGDFEVFTPSTVYAMGVIDLFAAARLTRDPRNPARPARIPPVLGDFKLFVTKRLSAPQAEYDPPLEFITSTNPGGFILLTGDSRSSRSQPVRPLAPGRYHWRVESDFYQSNDFEDDWPPALVYDQTKDLQLQPGPGYPFPDLTLKQRDLGVTLVRGCFFTASGNPATDGTVELILPALPASYAAFTKCSPDDQGNWALVFIEKQTEDPPPDFAHSRVRFRLGQNQQDDVTLPITPGTENVIRQTALRGRVVDGSGRGVPRARITTSMGVAESITKPDGQWSLYFRLNQINAQVQVTATAPDGRSARQNLGIQQGKTLVLPAMKIA
jgi:hypothetical protein